MLILLVFILVKLRQPGNIAIILVLLIASCIFYSLYQHMWIKYNGQYCSELAWAYYACYFATFNCAHWIYAVQFWLTSYKLHYFSENSQFEDQILVWRLVFWIGLVANISIPFIIVIGSPDNKKEKVTVEWLIFILQVVSAALLTDAVFRIKRTIKRIMGLYIETQ